MESKTLRITVEVRPVQGEASVPFAQGVFTPGEEDGTLELDREVPAEVAHAIRNIDVGPFTESGRYNQIWIGETEYIVVWETTS